MDPCRTTTLRYKLLWITTCLLALSIGTIPAAAQESLFGLDLANYLANLDQWPMFGQNQMNTAISLNLSLSPATVGKLAPRWTFKTGGDVSARAAVGAHGFLRAPDGTFTTFDAPGAGGINCGFGPTDSTGINAEGEITGFYTDINCEVHGFLREKN